MPNPLRCFVCNYSAEISLHPDASYAVSCPRCGPYEITLSLTSSPILKIPDLHILSGVLRQQTDNKTRIRLSAENIDALIRSAQIPNDPLEAIDQLLLHLFKQVDTADKPIHIQVGRDYPLVFAKNALEFGYYIQQARALNYIETINTVEQVRLTIDGWKRISQLRQARPFLGKRAFIAMQYADNEHTRIYEDHFRPATAQAGFDLIRLDKVLKAGLIDNQLRVHIRNSRFLLADLTNCNPGAYWEAGYAEGLGIPVIYLCKKSEFDTVKTHFDTNHHTTIAWDESNMSKATEELKATIRATFPSEAKLSDDSQ
jgi:hypothetical protein